MTELNFLELLINKGIISHQTAQELNDRFKGDNFLILLNLLDNVVAPKKKLGRLWGDFLGIAYIELDKAIFQKDVVQKLPEEFARKNKVILIYQLNRAITVATCDPKNEILLDKIEHLTNSQVSPVFSFPDEIDEAIDKHYNGEESLAGLTKHFFANKRGHVEELPSVIPEETKRYLVDNTQIINKQVSEGKIPDVAICNSVGNTIIAQVDEKIGVVQCINQLRVIDEYTYSHCVNVAMLSSALAKSLGYGPNVIKELALGALLHDLGKMQIPVALINKPGALNKEEFELVKKHTVYGYQIVKNMGFPEKISEIALNHHERVDGSGYPNGLIRDKIPMFSQIVAIIDVYDALVSDRPYKKGLSHHEALNIMLLEGQVSFNFDLLYKFVKIVYKEDFSTIRKTFKSVLSGESL